MKKLKRLERELKLLLKWQNYKDDGLTFCYATFAPTGGLTGEQYVPRHRYYLNSHEGGREV
jgi:hypothetical protein